MAADDRGSPKRDGVKPSVLRAKSQKAGKHITEASAPTVTEADRQAMAAFRERKKGKPLLPNSTVKVEGNDHVLGFEHDDVRIATLHLANILATDDFSFAMTLHKQLADNCGSRVSAANIDGALAMVRGIGPRDPTEALLATQMAAVHNATMRAANWLANAQNLPQQDSASTMLNKLARTFAAQVEALKKYRSAGEQTIKVEHVTVNEGGQAVVGIVQPLGGHPKNASQSHEPLGRDAAGAALPGNVETNGQALPSPGSTRSEGLPLSRSSRRSANGAGQRSVAPRSAQQ